MPSAKDAFARYAESVGVSVRPEDWDRLLSGAGWLARASTASGLSQYETPEQALIRAMGPALAYFAIQGAPRTGSLADLGSGTGAIGATIAFFAPNLQIDLVDRAKRSYTVSELLVSKLGVPNAHPCLGDIASLDREYDAAVLRALAPGHTALALAMSVVRPGGLICAYHRPQDEAFEQPAAEVEVLSTRTTLVHELVMTCYRR